MTTHPLLNMTSYGTETGTPLLIVHGLFGSGRNWRAIARHLSKDRWVITVDLRNHGSSFWDDDNSYFALADDLAQVIDNLGMPVDLLGHSMGGKAAMVLALQQADKINRLIIADIAPVAYPHTQADKIEIMQSIALENHDRRSSVQAELETKTGDAGLAAFFAQSVSFDGDALTWLLNLDALALNMDAIIGFPTVEGRFEKNALFLRGADSDYVDDVEAVKALFPAADVQTVSNAGHWLHAENPREFMKIVGEYLS